MRPGLYAQPPSLTDIVASVLKNTDLSLYEVDIDATGDNPKICKGSFDQRLGRIYSPVEENLLRGITYHDYNGNSNRVDRTALLLDRQWNIYDGPMPTPDNRDVSISSETTWDFNASMVRDPRHSIALPRIAVADEIRLQSVFQVPLLGKSGGRPPIAHFEQVHSDWSTKLPSATTKDEILEHEAPLLLLGPASKESVAKNSKK